MKPRASIVASLGLAALCFFAIPELSAAQGRVPAEEEQKHDAWLITKLEEVFSIRPGMTKADLLRVFEHDGGLQNTWPQRFVLRSCHLIKVDVEFNVPEGMAPASYPPDNELKIKSISKPYLEPMDKD